MDLAKRAMFLLAIILMTICGLSLSTVHKVGDSAGWTSTVDYSKWASSTSFYPQDILVFEYDANNHNVIQVSLPAFRSCNGSTPMAKYSTGNDSITIKNHGHYYYICGVPGHCQAGEKVDIRVLKNIVKTPNSTTNSTPTPEDSTSINLTPIDGLDNETPIHAASNRSSCTLFGFFVSLFELYLFSVFY